MVTENKARQTYSAEMLIHREFEIGQTDPRLFGSFVEHLGRAVYGGLYEPGHPTANAHGFRTDVLELVRELNVSLVRYPGGNYVSGHRWEDGVGPREQRPRRLDMAWRTIETNQFGLDEYIDWCRAAGCEPYMAVNLGLRDMAAAGALIEYANHPGGTELSDLRRRNGHQEPHAIKLWCLGNEMDGAWQIGAKTPEEYGRLAEETSKVMKWVDPTVELVACGSCASIMPTYPEWDRIVLERAHEYIDYISLHTYYGNKAQDTPGFLGKSVLMERYIETVAAACDFVKAKKRSKHVVNLAFNEWNVWAHTNDNFEPKERWAVAPPQLEEVYSMEDALVFACMYMALLRHCDRVKIGCQAQLVNAIAPIMTRTGGGVWQQTLFYPMQAISRYGRGRVLRALTNVPSYEHADVGMIPQCDLLAVDNLDNNVTIFAVNRSLEQTAQLKPRLEGFPALRLVSHSVLAHENLKAANTESNPNAVLPRVMTVKASAVADAEISLPAASFNVLRLQPA